MLAIDSRMSVSSVSATAAKTLRALGMDRHLPLLLAIAAHAAEFHEVRQAQKVEVTLNGKWPYAVSAALPDAGMAGLLSEAERGVLRLILQGRSHAEIAHARATSTRTVRNQLSNIFNKLNVRSRSGLISALIRRSGPSQSHLPKRSPSLMPSKVEEARPIVQLEDAGPNIRAQLDRIEAKLDLLLSRRELVEES